MLSKIKPSKAKRARQLAAEGVEPPEIEKRLKMTRQAVTRALEYEPNGEGPGRKRKHAPCPHCRGTGRADLPEWNVANLSARVQRVLAQVTSWDTSSPTDLMEMGRERLASCHGSGSATVKEIDEELRRCGYPGLH